MIQVASINREVRVVKQFVVVELVIFVNIVSFFIAGFGLLTTMILTDSVVQSVNMIVVILSIVIIGMIQFSRLVLHFGGRLTDFVTGWIFIP